MSGYLSHAMMTLCDAIQRAETPEADHAAAKHLLIAYGVAALTLDAARADQGLTLPDPIDSERDQFVALAYMLRCAPAHDISDPQWKIKGRFRRSYAVAGLTVDLTECDGAVFNFKDIGGPRMICHLASYAQAQGWA